MSFEKVHALKSEFSVSAACSALGLSRSGYYEWAARRARSEPVVRQNKIVCESRGLAIAGWALNMRTSQPKVVARWASSSPPR